MTKTRIIQQGFTLYELLITVLIIGVILSIGMPNLTEFAANSRVTAAANDLHSAFQLSRTEAARARENVTLCASATGTDCDSTSFDSGWIVFTDIDGDASVDGGDAILRVYPAVDSSIDITATDVSNNAADSFTFTPNGTGSGAAVDLSAATICDGRGQRDCRRRLVGCARADRNADRAVDGLRDKAQIENQGGCP